MTLQSEEHSGQVMECLLRPPAPSIFTGMDFFTISSGRVGAPAVSGIGSPEGVGIIVYGEGGGPTEIVVRGFTPNADQLARLKICAGIDE